MRISKAQRRYDSWTPWCDEPEPENPADMWIESRVNELLEDWEWIQIQFEDGNMGSNPMLDALEGAIKASSRDEVARHSVAFMERVWHDLIALAEAQAKDDWRTR